MGNCNFPFYMTYPDWDEVQNGSEYGTCSLKYDCVNVITAIKAWPNTSKHSNKHTKKRKPSRNVEEWLVLCSCPEAQLKAAAAARMLVFSACERHL